MDLFEKSYRQRMEKEAPLAARMRPRSLEQFVGQEHIVGPGRLLRRAIQADQLGSLIFYGPPGTGKTTLARVIANTTEAHFDSLNAVLAGVKDIRAAIEAAKERAKVYAQRTILFIDEVHRFNKAQQDALLPWVENGTVIFIGATTENPYFEVNKALVSRSRIFQLTPLTSDHLRAIVRAAIDDRTRGYGDRAIELDGAALDHLVDVAGGDARALLNALELAIETTSADEEGVVRVTLEVAEESIQRRAVLYDKEGDYHFDTISAFIKSLRGSDPDAALYWMAKMVYAGESPRFIFRRMLISASEDVGVADPMALPVVVACSQAFEQVGLPEGRFHLAQAALYLATCKKSNSTLGFFDALRSVEREGDSGVPNHLRDSNRDAESFGHGEGYLYPHAFRDHWVAQQYLPSSIQGKVFYQPSDQGYESTIRVEVSRRREAQLAAMLAAEGEGAPLETLTFSVRDRAAERWLQRTISSAGEQLGSVRDRIFESAHLPRHARVLDLRAGSGLLTWEAVRRAPEGGVYAVVSNAREASALESQTSRLDEMERPTLLLGDVSRLEVLLSSEPELRFDAVLGTNVLLGFDEASRAALIASIEARLAEGGVVSLAERIPRHTQRLYELIEIDRLGEDLAQRLAAAEEAIYDNDEDPLVSWDADDLAAAWVDGGFEVSQEIEVERREVKVTIALVERWFTASAGERPSYAEHLARELTSEEIETVRSLFERQLVNRVCPWGSRTVFLVARRG